MSLPLTVFARIANIDPFAFVTAAESNQYDNFITGNSICVSVRKGTLVKSKFLPPNAACIDLVHFIEDETPYRQTV